MRPSLTTAEGILGMSSPPGMSRTSAPGGPNMFDGGPASKVTENTQPFNNSRMALQSVQQNTISAASEANANARRQYEKQGLVEDNAKYKAIAFATDRKLQMMDAIGSPATEMMGNMNGLETQKFRHDIATGAAMGYGSPDLAAYQASTQDYA